MTLTQAAAPPSAPGLPGATNRPRTSHRAHVPVRLALLAGGLAIGAVWWLDTAAASVTGLGATVTSLGRVTGLLGAYLVLVQVLLMARLPWFERAVGLDRLAAWHRGLGTNVVVLLCAHVLLVVEGYSLTAHDAVTSQAWTVVDTYPDMVKATAGLALFLLVGATSGPRLRRRLSYEAWYWLHLGAYLAVALTFFHQVSTGIDFTGSDPRHVATRAVWTALYAAVAAAVLWWRVVTPAAAWVRHAMVVEKVVPEADGVVSVWVRGRRLDRLGARGGQFMLWRFVTPGHVWTAHPYSLSAAPQPQRLRLTVKDAGDHSRALGRLRPGVPVLAEGPFGHFTADAARRRRVLLVAGGSGIGPVRALAEELTGRAAAGAHRRAGDDVVVLYRASSADDLALAGELDDLAAAGRLQVRYLVGRRRDLGVDPLAPAELARVVPDAATREVYVCGPDGMTATVRRSAAALGVPRRHVHVEGFRLS